MKRGKWILSSYCRLSLCVKLKEENLDLPKRLLGIDRIKNQLMLPNKTKWMFVEFKIYFEKKKAYFLKFLL